MELKYPIAVDKISQELKYAGDVKNGLDCNCYCKLCERNMIAINSGGIQRSHFRHEANSNCSASYESYIHWVTKETFKEIPSLSLPDLTFLNLDIDFRRGLFQLFDFYRLPISFKNQIKEYLISEINTKTKDFKIKSVEIEKEVKAKTGKVRIDIIINFDGHKLFVEPYLTNPISADKLKLIREINTSTISICLKDFLKQKNNIFSKEELIHFLSHDLNSKLWEHHKINSRSFDIYLDKIRNLLEKNSTALKKYLAKEKELLTIQNELDELLKETEKIFTLVEPKTK
ncbi:MAG: hypothetical protein PSV16_00440 [Flavobacterium sp.]|nr:hypothetical protein [Flavobacterium sp.]